MSSVGEPPVQTFDAAALAKVTADNGGKINTVKAIQQIESGIRSDGKVTADEVALFTATMNNVAGGATAPFEVAAAEFGYERTEALKAERTIPGSFIIVGTPAQFADPMAMINDVGQLDELVSTTSDETRCGAATLAYEACFQGPDAMQKLIVDVRNDPAVDPAIRAALKGVDVRSGNISRKTFHLMVEAVYSVLNQVDPFKGGSGLSGGVMAVYMQVRNLKPSKTTEPPAGLQVGQRAMVMTALKPGSADRHWITIGRDSKGFYRLDPYAGSNTGTKSEGNTVHRFKSEAEMTAYVKARAFDFGTERTDSGGKVGVVTLKMGQ